MRPTQGFTLVELLAVFAVSSILLGLAVPAFIELVRNNQMAGSLNALSGSFALARSEALRHARQVVACKSANGYACTTVGGWEQGWIVFVDVNANERCINPGKAAVCDDDGGKILWREDAVKQDGLTLRATGNPAQRVAFSALGFASGYAGTFSLCDPGGAGHSRGLVLSMNGRVRLARRGDNVICR